LWAFTAGDPGPERNGSVVTGIRRWPDPCPLCRARGLLLADADWAL